MVDKLRKRAAVEFAGAVDADPPQCGQTLAAAEERPIEPAVRGADRFQLLAGCDSDEPGVVEGSVAD